MPQVELTSQLSQLADCPTKLHVEGSTVVDALEHLFADHGQMRSHVLAADGTIHPHLALFVDGEMIGRDQLDMPLGPNAEVFVMQALSGG